MVCFPQNVDDPPSSHDPWPSRVRLPASVAPVRGRRDVLKRPGMRWGFGPASARSSWSRSRAWNGPGSRGRDGEKDGGGGSFRRVSGPPGGPGSAARVGPRTRSRKGQRAGAAVRGSGFGLYAEGRRWGFGLFSSGEGRTRGWALTVGRTGTGARTCGTVELGSR